MTLANFNWTDKETVKWFILLPTGHEGPYSLSILEQRLTKKQLSSEIQIWAEGLASPLTLKEALNASQRSLAPDMDDELPPPLPPIPEEEIPPLPLAEVNSAPKDPAPAAPSAKATPRTRKEAPQKEKPKRLALVLVAVLGFIPLTAFFGYQYLQEQEKFSIRRYPKMSLELHQKIQNSFDFEGWNKKIFFKEYVPSDLSYIWLITSGHQRCEVEASFASIPEKLLAMKDQKIAFKTKGILQDHVTEMSEFSFSEGSRVIPGLYEMKVRATKCEWDGLLPLVANKFQSPEKDYEATTKVVLFSKGAEAYSKILDQLNHKRAEINLKKQSEQDLFWGDLQQKFQTLQAITLQVEQKFLDFLEVKPADFPYQLKPMVEDYTRQYGHFLTNFVVSNETYFEEIYKGELRSLAQKKNYEEMVRLTSKRVGHTSMTIIEELQGMKKPSSVQLQSLKKKVLDNFSSLKEEINQKIIEVTDDRSS